MGKLKGESVDIISTVPEAGVNIFQDLKNKLKDTQTHNKKGQIIGKAPIAVQINHLATFFFNVVMLIQKHRFGTFYITQLCYLCHK
jgi:hypothetical protein